MDTINLKDILNGKLTKLPFELDSVESQDFVIALADALATLQRTEFPDVEMEGESREKAFSKELQMRHNEFAVITDNFILFIMNEDNAFSTEIVMAAFIRAIRAHRVSFDSETDAFTAFYRKYQGWIVGGTKEGKGVYVGDGQYDKDWKPSTKSDNFGGNFTLRDHNKQ